MKLLVKTKDKTYPIYFGENNCFKINKILNRNNISPNKLIVIYDKNIPIAVTAEKNIEKLGTSISLEKPFKRTISRLYELTSNDYQL